MEWVAPAIFMVVMLAGVLSQPGLVTSRRAAVAAWPALTEALPRRREMATQLARALPGLPAPNVPARDQRLAQAMLKARDVAILAELSPAAAGEAELAPGAATQAFNRAALTHNRACLRAPGIFVAKLMNAPTVPYFPRHPEDRAMLEALRWQGIRQAR